MIPRSRYEGEGPVLTAILTRTSPRIIGIAANNAVSIMEATGPVSIPAMTIWAITRMPLPM